MSTPSSPSSRARETREASDTALLSKPETYGSFARVSVPGATSRDASSILPGSPTYGSGLSSSPFLNTPDRAAYARGRSTAAAAAAEAVDAHPDPRARVEAFAADLARVVRQPSDAYHAEAGREDPTAAMLRECKRALETETKTEPEAAAAAAAEADGFEAQEEEATVGPDADVFVDDAPSTARATRELEALTRPILAARERASRRAGYGSTAGKPSAHSDSDGPSEPHGAAFPVAASPGRASARMRQRARARPDPESAPGPEVESPKGPAREPGTPASGKQKRGAFDEELASLRLARETLERHVVFSKSLEGVVSELAKRVPRVAA